MKRIVVFAVGVLLATGSASAAAVPPEQGKDLCLLDINNCVGKSYYTIVEKLARIRAALALGDKVYSAQEISHLGYLLDEALETADRIGADPSQVPENKER